MISDELPSRSKLLLAVLIWFAIWFAIQVYAILDVTENWSMALKDASVALAFILIGVAILFFLQKYAGSYLNKWQVRIAFTVAVIAEIIYFQKIILENFYSSTAFPDLTEQTMLIRMIVAFSQVSFFSVVLWLLYYIKRQNEKTKQRMEADNLFKQAELSRLRQQLQPHFLFNSLNSINSLLVTEPTKARQMILNLSDFLRGTLKEDESKTVTLSEEIQVLKLYIEIEKVRFGHRLEIDFDVDDNVVNYMLPPLLLQPVLENAIKFGLYDVLGNVAIRLKAFGENGHLKIEVTNPFSPNHQKDNKGEGFGLGIIQKRLLLLYHRADLIKTTKAENQFTTTILIPQL